MQAFESFILERLKLNNDSKIKNKTNDKDAEQLAEYIIDVFNISQYFFRFEELKKALIKIIIDNDIIKAQLSMPYGCGKDHIRYLNGKHKYKKGRYTRVATGMKNYDIIVGDPKNDAIVFYLSKDFLLCHSTEFNGVDVNIYFIIDN